jgi:putative sigma-54 modulation protein
MTLNMSFRHMGASNALKAYTEEKSAKLKKYFRGKIHMTWTFTVEKQSRIAHCHMVGNHMDYFGEATTEDFHLAIDQVVDKIERQLRKHKEIVKDHHQSQQILAG